MDLKVLFVSSEVAPYAKSGGLGDVAGSLPKALKNEGVDIRVVFPKYKNIKQQYLDNSKYIDSFVVNLDWRNQSASVHLIDTEVPTYMIENDFYFGRDGLYGYGDDHERFSFFCKAVLELMNVIDFIPDIIHCNDWQSAPICLLLKDQYSKLYKLSNIKTLFTIHNLQYQGVFGKESLDMLELSDYYYTSDKLEYYSCINFMKMGLLYSDAISTVSNTYAYEVQTPQYGYGMDGILRNRKDVLYGIVNGIDYDEYNPAVSSKIYENFWPDNMQPKRENKRRLQEELGLPQRDVPVFGVISRLVDQKGINILIDALYDLMCRDIQLVILGTGDGRYEYLLRQAQYRYPDKVSANIMFDDTRAQRIYAGSDFFIMPSLFEPCGLGQLIAMSYGTIPVARTTGGLVDTVSHYNFENGEGNGFLFQDFISSGLVWGVDQALRAYYDDYHRNKVMSNAINTRFSWEKSAKNYIDIYNSLK